MSSGASRRLRSFLRTHRKLISTKGTACNSNAGAKGQETDDDLRSSEFNKRNGREEVERTEYAKRKESQ